MATATSKIDAVYARYSSHGQDGNTSVEVQVEECERAAGRKLVPYIDRACTGRATAQRAELLRLLDDAEKGRVGTLWLFKWDRLARNLGQATVVMEQMQDFGVEVRVANGTDHPLVRNIELAVAEDYSRVLAERALKGMVKRAEQGRWVAQRVMALNGRVASSSFGTSFWNTDHT